MSVNVNKSMDIDLLLHRKITTLCFSVIMLLYWQSHANAESNSEIRLGIHPYLAAEELHKRFTPLTNYLSKHLNTPVTLHIAKDYESHITLTGTNSLDISYLGPASYVTVSRRYGQRKILGRLEVNGKPYFQGYIIVRADSNMQKLSELAGKRVAFSSSRSTMGYRVPKFMLKKIGLKLEDLGEQQFLGSHENVVLGVLAGEFDAGAVKEEVFNKYKSRGVRSLARSDKISEHLFVSKKSMPESQANAIQQLLFNLGNTSNGKEILASIKKTVTGIVSGADEDYNNLYQIMK